MSPDRTESKVGWFECPLGHGFESHVTRRQVYMPEYEDSMAIHEPLQKECPECGARARLSNVY